MSHAHHLTFRVTEAPITGAVTKFGGQPAWLAEPVQPLSRRTGEPMTFIAQIRVPADWYGDTVPRVAYLFMTGAGFDYRAVETWDPADGETAVVVQHGEVVRASAVPYPNTLCRWDESGGRRHEVPQEYAVDETAVEEADPIDEAELDALPDAERDRIVNSWNGNKIGGSPCWVQYAEFPFTPSRLLLQLVCSTYPFNLNHGGGIGYVFLDQTGREGNWLWQC